MLVIYIWIYVVNKTLSPAFFQKNISISLILEISRFGWLRLDTFLIRSYCGTTSPFSRVHNRTLIILILV